jgi:hypothetical protein
MANAPVEDIVAVEDIAIKLHRFRMHLPLNTVQAETGLGQLRSEICQSVRSWMLRLPMHFSLVMRNRVS